MIAKFRTGAVLRQLNIITFTSGIVSGIAPRRRSHGLKLGLKRIAILSTTALISLATLPGQSFAQQTWDTDQTAALAGGTGTWDATTTNWTSDNGVTNQAYVSGSNLTFGTPAGTISVDGAQTIGNLKFGLGGYSIVAGTNGSLVIPLNVTSAINTVALAGTTTISVPVTGAGALQKDGAGALNLNGTLSYTGGTIVNAGSVNLNATNRLPLGGDLTVNGGTLNMLGFDQSIGNLSGTGGTIDTGPSSKLTINQTVDGTYAGNFAGTTGLINLGIVKNGAATLTLTGTSLQTGTDIFQINAGKVQVQNGNAIGDNLIVSIGTAGTFELLSNETIGNLGLGASAQVLLNGNTLTFKGDGRPAGTTTVYSGGTTSTISGTGSLFFDTGNDSTELGGTHTYSGATTIKSGTFGLVTGASIRSTDITVSGGTFNVTGGALLGTNGTGKDAAVKVSAGNFNVSGAETIASLDLSGTGTVAITGTSSMTVTGATKISGGALTTPAGVPLNTAAFAMTGGTVNGSATADGTATDIDGANVNAGYSVVASGGTVASLGATGISASTTGTGTMRVQTKNNGINLTGNSGVINNATLGGIGIKTTAQQGNTTILLGANVSALGDGIQADSTSGSVTISGTGNITGGNVAGADGIQVTTTTGNATVDVTGTISGDPGILMTSSSGGNLTVSGTGDVTGAIEGVKLSTTGGNGNILVNRNGNISGGTGAGVNALTSAGSGNITIQAATGKTISSTGAAGILAAGSSGIIDINGAGAISGKTSGIKVTGNGLKIDITGTGTTAASDSGADAIDAVTNTSVANNGNINITRSGTVTGGIEAWAKNEGNVSITGTGNLTAKNIDGINAVANSGNITITPTGTITVATGTNTGIYGFSEFGSVDIKTAAAISGAGIQRGIFAETGTGNKALVVDLGGDITATQTGIEARVAGGSLTIKGAGNVTGGTKNAIDAYTKGGAVSITVAAGKTVSASSEAAISINNTVATSTNTISNSGTILGSFTAIDGNDSFTTLAGGLWAPSALNGGPSTSDFGTGSDIVTNAGTFQVSDLSNTNGSAVSLTGLETFTNTGRIEMQNGVAGTASKTVDTLTIANAGAGTTTFNGGGTLAMDAFVDKQGASDTLIIGTAGDVNNNGVVTGVTQIVLNDTNPSNAGQADLVGTELVRVENTVAGAGASNGAFVLSGGAIKKGFWTYDIYLDTSRAEAGRASADVFILGTAPTQSTENFTDVVAGAQNAFNVSANIVSSRMEGNRNTGAKTRSRTGLSDGDNGFWVKGAASRLSRQSSSTFTLFGTPTTTNTSYNQTFGAGIVGTDFALQDPGGRGGDLVLGFFVGAISGNQTFDASTATADTKGNTIGVYASYNLDSGVYADVSLQQDRFKTTWADPALVGTAGYAPQTIPGRNTGITIGGGYKMELANPGSWVDPFFTLNYVSTKYDPFTTGGATVSMGTNKSMRAKVGVRAGSEVQTDAAKYNFFASGALVRENLASNNVTMTGGASTFTLNSPNNFNALNVGIGVDVKGYNSPWSISARADADAGAKARGIAASIEFGIKF